MKIEYYEANKQRFFRHLLTIARLCKNQEYKSRYKKILSVFGKENGAYYIWKEVTNEELSQAESKYMAPIIMAAVNKKNTRKRIPETEKAHLMSYQNGICPWCHKPIVEPVVDHIIPWRIVGDELDGNYQVMCKQCNLDKGHSTANIEIA